MATPDLDEDCYWLLREVAWGRNYLPYGWDNALKVLCRYGLLARPDGFVRRFKLTIYGYKQLAAKIQHIPRFEDVPNA